jgi:hypothetical protein
LRGDPSLKIGLAIQNAAARFDVGRTEAGQPHSLKGSFAKTQNFCGLALGAQEHVATPSLVISGRLSAPLDDNDRRIQSRPQSQLGAFVKWVFTNNEGKMRD